MRLYARKLGSVLAIGALGAAGVSRCAPPSVTYVGADSSMDPDSGDVDASVPDADGEDAYDGEALDGVSDAGAPGDGDSATEPYRRVFITSKSYAPNFGGLSAGDAICAAAASAAGLGGHWAAWLSDTTTSAASRLEHATVPYELVDGTVIAANWTSLIQSKLTTSINVDENNHVVPLSWPPTTSGFAWTGTNADGTTMTGSTCSDWTYTGPQSGSHSGACGLDNQTDGDWTAYSCYCDSDYTIALYCVEQP
jgi:hypothetical protein